MMSQNITWGAGAQGRWPGLLDLIHEVLTARIHRFHGVGILDYRRIDPGELSDHHGAVVPDTDRSNDDLVQVYP